MQVSSSVEQAQRLQLPDAGCGSIDVWRVNNRVGESPQWQAEEQALYWIDVRAPQLLRLVPATRALTRWQLPEPVGAMALWGPGRVRLALRQQLVELDTATGSCRPLASLAGLEPATNRLNDGKRSPSGRWFVFGSMDDGMDKQASGSLYRASEQGEVRRLHAGLVVANGIAWSPDARTLYFSDSARGLVWQAPWDEERGEMGPPALLAQLGEGEGRPDGAQVDAAGRYWSAGVSAGVINILDPAGRLARKIHLPCRAPTMCAFGMAGQVWVTSLVRPQWEAPGLCDGALLMFSTP